MKCLGLSVPIFPNWCALHQLCGYVSPERWYFLIVCKQDTKKSFEGSITCISTSSIPSGLWYLAPRQWCAGKDLMPYQDAFISSALTCATGRLEEKIKVSKLWINFLSLYFSISYHVSIIMSYISRELNWESILKNTQGQSVQWKG